MTRQEDTVVVSSVVHPGHPLALQTRNLELEDFRRAVNRKLWLGMGALSVAAIGALCVALALAVKPTPVVVFDSEGQPVVFEDTVTPALSMSELRVKAFARRFLKVFVAMDAQRMNEELAAATTMMTPRFRRIFVADDDAVQRRAQFRSLNLRARLGALTFRIAPFAEDDPTGRIHLWAWGPIVFRPASGPMNDEHSHTQHVLVQLTLQRAPVSETTIHGLFVDFASTKMFETQSQLEAELVRVQP